MGNFWTSQDTKSIFYKEKRLRLLKLKQRSWKNCLIMLSSTPNSTARGKSCSSKRVLFKDSSFEDQVDRGILFQKMRQLNFHRQVISYLEEYYFNDCIHTYSGGKQSRRQYQTRGLRQGFPLLAILFVIYLIELSNRLDGTGLWAWMSPGFILAYFLFVNNLLLAAKDKSSLLELKNVLEKWAVDFRMKISHKKTQVISHSKNVEWSITDTSTGEPFTIEQVEACKYLGITQKLTLKQTTNAKGKQMIKKTASY